MKEVSIGNRKSDMIVTVKTFMMALTATRLILILGGNNGSGGRDGL
jgi:hypothetical protein